MAQETLEQLIDRLRAVEAQIEAAFAARAAHHAAEHEVRRDPAGKPCFKEDALRRQKATARPWAWPACRCPPC